MDFKKQLLQEHSLKNAENIAQYIFDHKNTLIHLLELFWEADPTITQRASWPLLLCSQSKTDILLPYLQQIIFKLHDQNISTGIKRNTVRILENYSIPANLDGILAEICFKYLNDSQESIAVKVFSMSILEKIANKYPELKQELMVSIEKGMEFGSAGYKSRGGKILKRLKK